jgi:hypothetical protein
VSDPTNVVEATPLLKAIVGRLTTGLPKEPTPGRPPTYGYLTEADDVPVLDKAGHVHRYWVLHPAPGSPSPEQDLGDALVDADWDFQVTAAAGYTTDVLDLAWRISALLYRWAPVVEGYACSPIKPPTGFSPGNVLLDRDEKPHRPFLPLQFRTRVDRVR